MKIELQTAMAIVSAAQEYAASHRLQPLTTVVLDSGGHLIAAQRQDRSSNKRFDIAFGKAHGALSLGVGSRALMARAEDQPYFIAAATAAVGGSLIPVPGGVLILDPAGELIGAVGVSGDSSDNDESAAVAGIRHVELEPKVD